MKQLNKPKREPLARTWFLGHGFHQVPPTEYIDFKILYAHEDDLRFANKYGQVLKQNFNPYNRNPKNSHGHPVPFLRNYSHRKCHVLRALAFYGERTVFIDGKTGKSYFGQCHHLNADLEDHRRANLLAWLSHPQHRIADTRQSAMREIVPNGDLRGLDKDILREMQDPRTMTQDEFNRRMEYLRIMHECDFDPRIYTKDDFHHFFSLDFDFFKKMLLHHKDGEE